MTIVSGIAAHTGFRPVVKLGLATQPSLQLPFESDHVRLRVQETKERHIPVAGQEMQTIRKYSGYCASQQGTERERTKSKVFWLPR